MDSHTAPAVDVTAFRNAMGSFPTGVTVVTVAIPERLVRGYLPYIEPWMW